MLRRKVSTGLLRAAANASASSTGTGVAPLGGTLALSASASSLQTTQQTASLVSAVLLPSKKNWREQTVVELKNELKRRGLSQSGNKATLVTRLASSDTSAHLPAIPTLPKQSSYSRRALSTSDVRAKDEKKSTAAPATAAQGSPSASPVSSESVTSAGPAVVSQRTEAPKTEQVKPEQVTVAPGLPATKAVQSASKEGGKSAEGMTPSIPLSDLADQVTEQVIPLEPDNFRSQQHLPTETKVSDTDGLPKVLSVASNSSLPGPSHATYDDAVPESKSKSDSESKDEEGDFSKIDLPGLGSILTSVAISPVRAVQSLGSVFGGLSIGAPAPSGGGNGKKNKGEDSGEYKSSNEPLNSEERRGAWILAGIVSAGLLLGGGSGKGSKGSVVDKVKGSVKGEGVKGDENWDKASGAGIVGHGSRKA